MDTNRSAPCLAAISVRPAQGQVVVAVAGQHGPDSRPFAKLGSQLASDGEGHVLFAGLLPAANGAGVLAPVAGVDRDHHVAQARRLRLRFSGHRSDAAPRGAGELSDPAEIEHQPVAAPAVRLEEEGPGPCGLVQIEDDAVNVLAALGVTNPDDAAVLAETVLELRPKGDVLEVEHHPVGPAEREQFVGDRSGEIEYHPGVAGRIEHPHSEHGRGGRGGGRRRLDGQQQGRGEDEDRPAERALSALPSGPAHGRGAPPEVPRHASPE